MEEYPRWFKSKYSDLVVQFYGLKSGLVIMNEKGLERTIGDFYKNFAPHTDISLWEEVTHLYKDLTEIQSLKMCGTPKCEHDIPYDSECKECQGKEINKYFQPKREEDKKPFSIEKKLNKYKRKVPNTEIDVYDILKAFSVVNPAAQHAIKKLLCAGDRGYKDKLQDLKEALASINRAIELEENDV